MKTQRIGSKREVLSDAAKVTSSPDTAATTPLAEDGITKLHDLFATFAALPTVEKMAGLIEADEVSLIKDKANEASSWFRALAHLLDNGPEETLSRPRSSFPSYHSVIEVHK
jgi:hypothetical protein